MYEQFPSGESAGYGRAKGFNTFVRLNDRKLFTDEALKDPAVRAFLRAPFSVTYAQFKSSHREAEYFIHKPHLAMTGQVNDIEGRVRRMPRENAKIATLVINHEATLAKHIMRSLIIEDGAAAGQMIHKQEDGDSR
ncbi:MAG: hypothetical protein ACRDGV_02845 [Candidatus Limnocylindria bacterium]